MGRTAKKRLFYAFSASWILLLGLLLPCATVIAFSGTNSTRVPVANGPLVSYISSFENTVLSSGYVAPTEGEIQLIRKAASMLVAGLSSHDPDSFSTAIVYASRVRYEVVNYTDTDSESYHYVLREKSSRVRGYGIFIFNPVQSSNVIVEVPHPGTDVQTGTVGIRIYSDSRPRAFLMAGARRDAGAQADVARNVKSFFEAVHETLVSSKSIVVQVHGFSQSNRVGYPEVVISTGSAIVSSWAQALRNAFVSVGFEVGIYDGSSWDDLAGTTNVQGKYVNLIGASFLHVELSLKLRTENQPLTVDALTSFVSGTLGS